MFFCDFQNGVLVVKVYIKHASIILKVPNGTLYLLRDIECVPLGNIDKTQL